MTLSTLNDLERELSEGKGPSRELDARIIWTLFPDGQVLIDAGDVRTRRPGEYGKLADFPLTGWAAGDWDALAHSFAGNVRHFDHNSTQLTTSIDAAVALCERVLPGAEYRISTLYQQVAVELPLNMDCCAFVARSDGHVPLAYCTAIIRAKIAEAGGENG